MFKKFQEWGLLSVLIISVGLNSGWGAVVVGAAAGVGGVMYIQGVVVKNVDAPIKELHEVVLESMGDQEMFVLEDELNVHSASIKAEYENGEPLKVQLRSLTEQATEIRIRVGTWGNETKSLLFLEDVEDRL